VDASTLTPAVWDEIRGRTVRNARRLPAEALTWHSVAEPYCCIFASHDGSYHLLVAAAEGAEAHGANALREVDVNVLREHKVSGRRRQTYIDLRCNSSELLLPFTRLVQDIAILVLRDSVEPLEAFNTVAAAWRAFWAPRQRPPLSQHEQIGLIGELLVMSGLIALPWPAVASWNGPDKDRHDFRFAAFAIEVKTAVGGQRRHTIGSLEQLTPSPNIPLFLASVLLEPAAAGPITLTSCVASVLSAAPTGSRALLEEKLAAVGYSPVYDEEYSRHRYVAGEIACYEVGDSFPRILRGSFSPPLAREIEGVMYRINLEGRPYTSIEELIQRRLEQSSN